MTDTAGNTVGRAGSGKRSSRSQGKSFSPARRREIVEHLSAADKKLAALIEQVGPFSLKVDELQSGYEALAESIIYQQITGKAAQSILNKVKANLGQAQFASADNHSGDFPSPRKILSTDFDALRACGLSRGKALALQDLAQKSLPDEDGNILVPSIEEMHQLDDQELIRRLTLIRGIGPWTVQMLLIFRLGREDVLPATDYGVRKGFALTYFGKRKAAQEILPTPAEIARKAERWRPFRSAASWYL